MPGKVLHADSVRPYRPRRLPGEEQAEFEENAARGFEAGLEKGRAAARGELEQAKAEIGSQIAQALGEVQKLRTQLFEEYRAELVSLALTAAARLVRARIEEGDPVAARVLEEVLGTLPARTPSRVELHPEDIEMIEATRLLEGGAEIELVPNPSLSRGSLVVRAGGDEIDARLETALAALRDAAWDEE